MDRGLRQQDVARLVGATTQTVTNWELGRTRPEPRHLPKILTFLGYDPRPQGESLGERLRRKREGLGLTQRGLARCLGVDATTVYRLEKGRKPKSRRVREIVDDFIDS
jgi:transcriptional regulator with XRE-family HTH domain